LGARGQGARSCLIARADDRRDRKPSPRSPHRPVDPVGTSSSGNYSADPRRLAFGYLNVAIACGVRLYCDVDARENLVSSMALAPSLV
jgi:hypothetical protein